jgi:hypothetical protein
MLKCGLSGGPPQLCCGPGKIVIQVIVSIAAGRNPRRVLEDHGRMRCGPRVSAACRGQAAMREGGIVRGITASRNRHHCGQPCCRAGALIRGASGADHIADKRVSRRHHKAAEMFTGLLMPDAAIRILQLQHPVQIPADFGQIVRQLAAALRNTEPQRMQLRRKHLPCPKQGSGGDGRIDDITTIIACVVPAAVVRQFSTFAGGGVKRTVGMTQGVRVAAAEINRATAALPVEGTHGQTQRIGVDRFANRERIAVQIVYLESITAWSAQRGKIHKRRAVSRGCILQWRAKRTCEERRTAGSRYNLK